MEELANEVYTNSRLAREAPISASADETITRLYSQKAKDIRMRTAKKNESGIKNQSICTANDEYEGWSKGDLVGSGYTFISVSYPGSSLNRGSVFREKDTGDILQMIFSCGDYFRNIGMELVTDSHFGHFVPAVFLRTWGIYMTSSFSQNSRLGISNITELSRKKYDPSQKQTIIDGLKKFSESKECKEEQFDPFADSSSSSEEEKIKPYGIPKRKKTFRSVKTPLKLFEKKLSMSPKGTYKVWKASFNIPVKKKFEVFLHAVNDSKTVFRISTKHAALPAVKMSLTDKNKKRIVVTTSKAHESFRKRMGNNDQSDAKRAQLGLSARYYKYWPKKTIAKIIEDAIINGGLNLLLDPGCQNEDWITFCYGLVQELLDSGDNLRHRSSGNTGQYKRSYLKRMKRPRPGSDEVLEYGLRCKGGRLSKCIKFLQFASRSRQCAFCGRARAFYRCRSCDMHLCMQPPRTSPSGVRYPVSSPPCYLRAHGTHNYS